MLRPALSTEYVTQYCTAEISDFHNFFSAHFQTVRFTLAKIS